MVSRNLSRSLDHVNWWNPEHWKLRGPRSQSSASLEDTAADPMEIRNGWLTLDTKARFQQKQMQEKELKIASLYEAQQARALDRVRHSPGSVTSSPPPAPPPLKQPGKVRQMFEERRTKAGIDKSYPLKPIQNTERPAARKPLPNGYSKVTSTNSMTSNSSKVVEKKSTVKTKTTTSLQNVKKYTQSIHKVEKIMNGNGDVNHNHVEDLNSSNNEINHIGEQLLPSADELDKDNNLIENETFPEALAPEPTPRSAERRPEKVDKPERPPRKSPPAVTRSPVRTKPQPVPAAPPRRSTPTGSSTKTTVPDVKKAQGGAMQRKTTRSTTTAAAVSGADSKARLSSAGGGGGLPCSVCGRRFAQDRLPTHEAICKKHTTKKRKPFDALKHRLAGTEAEPFIGKLRKSTTGSSNKSNKSLNSSWRKKHEEFIASIRAAKQVQAHLNAGGKLSDLPPPPPSENADYVSCPHCGRRFNQAAAERHIPKCANYQFNKPKPSAKKR